MTYEGFCEKHGPYDARLGGCPYCGPRQAHGRPQPPPQLDDPDEPTDPWAGRRSHPSRYETDDLDETDPRAGRRTVNDDLGETELPRRAKTKSTTAWGDDDEKDATEVDRPAKTGLLGWLVVKEGQARGHIYEIKGEAIIGRGDQAKLRIRDSKISRMHARITLEDKRFVLWDFGSENGTFVNGERVRSATPLQENDEIKMGGTLFVLKTLE